LLLDLKRNPALKGRFQPQMNVLICAREAAKMVGATPMDRPEDIKRDPVSGDIIVACTNNIPMMRHHGSLLKIKEKDNDPGALQFTAEVFLMG